MKVITIGTDKKLFEETSSVLSRQLEYSTKMEELHIVVCTHGAVYTPRHIGNLHIYPTNSTSKLMWVFNAYSLGKKIIIDNKFVRGLSVISTQDPFESGLAGYLISRKFRLPFQVQIHTDFFTPYFKNTFLNRVRYQIARFLVPRADGIRVVSENLKQLLLKNFSYLKTVPSVLPIYVDIQKLIDAPIVQDVRKEYARFNFIILMASRLTPEKEIDTALHALKQLVPDFPHMGLLICGEGGELPRLRKLVDSLEIRNNVVFVPWQENLVSLYKTANVFLLTSRFEGYGMTLIEAGASGVPVISTPVGIAEKIITSGVNGLLCPIGDSHCFAQGIQSLVLDNTKRELYKRALQDSIRGLATSPEDYIAGYVGLLERLIHHDTHTQ